MSIKSEKAKEILGRSYDGGHICMENAEAAIKAAESDARERAVRCIRESCTYHYMNECHKYADEAECIGNNDCFLIDNFLKHYDNGQ